jgi:hypothetical protein
VSRYRIIARTYACYHRGVRGVALAVLVVLAATACPSGGEYVPLDRSSEGIDKGDTNGRTFDFVSNKPDGDEWDIRLRGTSMFVSYSKGEEVDKLGGAVSVTDKESRKVWRLVDRLDIQNRKKGKRDPDTGYVTLVLHEPGENETQHDIFTIYVERDTADDDVIALATYLRELVTKYKKETPNF